VTGSLLVPSSRFASDDPADDGSSTVSAVDGSSTAVPVGDGFVADTGSPGSAVAISAAGDGFVSAVGDEVAPGLCVSLPDSIFLGLWIPLGGTQCLLRLRSVRLAMTLLMRVRPWVC
jgi:hypothetical protein